MPKPLTETIFDIAEEHEGLVPASAARARGIAPSALVKMANRGKLERVGRGVYRLPLFPSSASRLQQYYEALAWAQSSRGPRAVISHESALALYGISDVLPAKIHITVRPEARFRHRAIPPKIRVHHAPLPPDEIDQFEGIEVTSPDRAIRDVAEAGRTDLAFAAISDAIRKGFIDKKQGRRLMKELASISGKHGRLNGRKN